MTGKIIKFVIIAALVITATYVWAWMEAASMSERYYRDALDKFNEGGYLSSLKGEQLVKSDKSGYYFSGGFQQVVKMWGHPMAYPKPGEYYLADRKIDEIIDEKMTVEMGAEAFKQYFRQDNFYLGRILLRTGDIYLESGNVEKAMDTYEMVEEIFILDEELASQAKKKIQGLSK